MPWTQTELDTLKSAIAASGGVQQVRYADGSAITYLSPTEALKLLQIMQLDVNAAATPTSGTVVRSFRGALSSGY